MGFSQLDPWLQSLQLATHGLPDVVLALPDEQARAQVMQRRALAQQAAAQSDGCNTSSPRPPPSSPSSSTFFSIKTDQGQGQGHDGGGGGPELAVLLGWAASKASTVAKYAHLYTDRGIPAVCVGTSLLDIWSTRMGLLRAEALLRSLAPVVDQRATLLHMFSGGGYVVWPYLLRCSTAAAATTSTLICGGVDSRWAGFVFDSGPAQFGREPGLAAAKAALETGQLGPVSYTLAVGAGLAIDAVVGARKRREQADALGSQVFDVPQLYLYSDSDPVCPPAWVEAIASGQARLGRTTHRHCFSGSAHVEHLRTHRAAYTARVSAFLDNLR